MQPSVGVVIPARNDAKGLPRAVATVLAQAGVHVDVITVAVGPSSDETEDVAAQLAREHGVVQVIANPSGRTPEALNLAIEATDADVIARVDARSQLPSDYLANALETMTDTGAGNVGAIQRPVGDTTTQRGIAAAMASRFGTGGAAYRGTTERKQVDTAWLGVFRRDALVAVGGYDESFTRNQDAELNLRLNAQGHEVWVDPRMVVDYRGRSSLRQLSSQYWQYGWWRQLTVRKHPGSLRGRQALPAAGVAGIVVLAGMGAFWSRRWFLPIAGYGGALIAIGLSQGTGGLRERLTMSGALATMHVSWGAGFLASYVRSAVGPR